MTNANAKKARQLGMPFGTASGRLRKGVMLHLLVQLNQNICYRCGELILSPDDLSLDHKTDWLDNDIALFWNVNNVAFSHRKCNKTTRPGFGSRKIGPKGTAWCSGCKAFLPVVAFHKCKDRWNGLRTSCKSCRKR